MTYGHINDKENLKKGLNLTVQTFFYVKFSCFKMFLIVRKISLLTFTLLIQAIVLLIFIKIENYYDRNSQIEIGSF
jgi:hypothetical protein